MHAGSNGGNEGAGQRNVEPCADFAGAGREVDEVVAVAMRTSTDAEMAMMAPRGRRSTRAIAAAAIVTTRAKTPLVRSMPFSENGGLSDHVRKQPTMTSPKPMNIASLIRFRASRIPSVA